MQSVKFLSVKYLVHHCCGIIPPSSTLLLFSERQIDAGSGQIILSMWEGRMVGRRIKLCFHLFTISFFFFFFNNTSADVKTICLVPRSLCVISLFTAVFPKRELPSSGSFSKTQFSKQIYTQVSSIFENKGYHIFPRGIDERREDAENRV